MTPDARAVAFISDRSGVPQLWIQDVVLDGPPPPAPAPPALRRPGARGALGGRQPVAGLRGGHRRRRAHGRSGWSGPTAREARRIAGDPDEHAELGPWTRSGHRVRRDLPRARPRACPRGASSPTRRPAGSTRWPSGELIHVLDVSLEERFLVIRDGERGQQFCVVVDRLMDEAFSALPAGATGSTDVALLRPAPDDHTGPVYVYLASDVGLPRRQLIGLPFGPERLARRAAHPGRARRRRAGVRRRRRRRPAAAARLERRRVAASSSCSTPSTRQRTPVAGPARAGGDDAGAQPRRPQRDPRRRGPAAAPRAVAPGHRDARLDGG